MKLTCSATRMLICVTACLTIAGCEQPMPQGPTIDASQASASDLPIMIATEAASYAAGATVAIFLTNRTGRPVGYNLCRASTLEVLSGDGDWRRVNYEFEQVCTAELRVLAPGQTAPFRFKTEQRLRAGKYRVRTTLQDPNGPARLDVVSNIFALTREGSD